MSAFEIPHEAMCAIQEHAKDEFPREACGAITPDGFLPLQNMAGDPVMAFDCSRACDELLVTGKLIAVVHSHTNGRMGPSSWDMRQQEAMNIPWGLVVTDGKRVSRPFFWGDCIDPPPLERRDFRHGPSGTDGKGDCYALIRDWWRVERQVILPEFPRDDAWWGGAVGGENLYINGFGKAGFQDVGTAQGLRDPQIGDVFLARIRSRVPNHGGVYVGEGMILHHMGDCLSIKRPLGQYTKLVTNWLRRDA